MSSQEPRMRNSRLVGQHCWHQPAPRCVPGTVSTLTCSSTKQVNLGKAPSCIPRVRVPGSLKSIWNVLWGGGKKHVLECLTVFLKGTYCRTTFIKYQYLQKPKEHTLRNVSIEDALSNSSEITHPWLLVAFSRHEWPWLSKLLSWGSTTCLMPSWSLVAVPGLQGRTRLLSWVTPKMHHLKNTFHSLQSPTVFGFQVGDYRRLLCIP